MSNILKYISILKSWVRKERASPNVNTKNKNYNMSNEVVTKALRSKWTQQRSGPMSLKTEQNKGNKIRLKSKGKKKTTGNL